MKWRISLAQLMALIVVLAVGLAAMKVASEIVFQALFCLSILTLLAGTLGAMVRQRREAWVGFSFFGWIYALVALVPPIQTSFFVKIPIDIQINRFVEWLHPAVAYPPDPLMFHAWKSGNQYLRVTQGMSMAFQPSDDEAKLIDEYMIQSIPAINREQAFLHAPSIAFLFLGAAFAISGAALGHLLSDRSGPAQPTLAAESSTPTV
jgi:hypothetical protein